MPALSCWPSVTVQSLRFLHLFHDSVPFLFQSLLLCNALPPILDNPVGGLYLKSIESYSFMPKTSHPVSGSFFSCLPPFLTLKLAPYIVFRHAQYYFEETTKQSLKWQIEILATALYGLQVHLQDQLGFPLTTSQKIYLTVLAPNIALFFFFSPSPCFRQSVLPFKKIKWFSNLSDLFVLKKKKTTTSITKKLL